MATTKKRAAPKKRASSSRTKSKTSRSKSRSAKAKPARANSAARAGSASRPSSGSSANGGGAVDSVRHTVEDKAKTAGQAVGSAASKAKVPLIAGGAALAGAAGGLALATRQGHRRSGLVRSMRRPKVKLTSRDVAKAAKGVGNFSAQMGELATELQRAREETGNGRHRSPVEVVLQGLTARR
jgi:hypothetical protein